VEYIGDSLRGMYRDTLFNAENRLIFDSGWASNTIVYNCRVLLASFMKGESKIGISHMKVGWGCNTWIGVPPKPDGTEDQLENAYSETISIASMKYLHDENESPFDPEKPNNRLEIKVILYANVPVNPDPNNPEFSPLREFGLFSKQNDKAAARMINCVRHPLIQKAKTDTLIRVVRLVF